MHKKDDRRHKEDQGSKLDQSRNGSVAAFHASQRVEIELNIKIKREKMAMEARARKDRRTGGLASSPSPFGRSHGFFEKKSFAFRKAIVYLVISEPKLKGRAQ